MAIQVHLRRSDYAVTGSTVAQIGAVIDLLGPARDGRRFGAYTDWEVAWSYDPTIRGGEHVFDALSVDVTIAVTLPRWRPVASAPREVVEAWRRYRDAVERHEDGHRSIAVEAGRAVHDALAALPGYPSKTALREAAAAAAGRALDEHGARERDYDRATDHGAKQGVSLAIALASAVAIAVALLAPAARADVPPTAAELGRCRNGPDQICSEIINGVEVLGICMTMRNGHVLCGTGPTVTPRAEAIVARQQERRFWMLTTVVPAALALIGVTVGSVVIIGRRRRRAKERWERAEREELGRRGD